MIVAAHQPNFMPWVGYFDKMRKADLFVSVDHVQMERQSFQNRTRIKTGAGAQWITVPVVQASRDELIMEKRIDNSRDGRSRWSRTMLLTLKYAYQSAPGFKAWENALAEVLEAREESLSELNARLIELFRGALGIQTPMVKSSSLAVEGRRSEMVLDLCRKVGADAYLAGAGASKGYLDVAAFERAGIKVLWQDFQHPRYRQLPGPEEFIERLSVVDMLFNCGTEAADYFRPAVSPRTRVPA
ncbi:MAG: WbqC family protein [Elusimicrobia bacterium]|nr:WbqC family protein [Elusimicrobiota bacterium]